MEVMNQPAAITPHSAARVVWWFPSKMMTNPRAISDRRKKPLHTQPDRTDRDSLTSHFSP
jgi:hypothetical protein